MAFNGFVSNKGGTGKRKALGTALPEHVRDPYTFSTPRGINIKGTLLDKNGVVITPSGVDQVIEEGYYPGTLAGGKVAAVAVDASKVLDTETIAGVQGQIVTKSGIIITPSTAEQVIAAGYYTGLAASGKVLAVSFDASKVLEGTTIAGTPGAMANKPGQVVSTYSRTLQNLVTNGSFESGIAAWGYSPILPTVSTTSKFGTNSMSVVGTPSYAESVAQSPVIPYIQGHKYYASVWVRSSVAGKTSDLYWPIVPPYPAISVSCVLADVWYRNSFISADATIASGNLPVRLDNNNANTSVTMLFDGLCVIDLTASFGAGSEPTKAQMDSQMDLFGGWFDGSVVIEKIVQGGYVTNGLSGTPEVLIKDDNLISGNIKKNTIILGIPGKSTVADCSDCNVGSTGQVLAGVTAYGSDGNKFTGTMPNLGSEEYAGWRRADVFYPSDPGRVHLRIPLGAYLTGNAAQGGQLGVFCDDANFTPGNMLAGKTYFGLAGSAPIKYYATGTYAPGGTIISVDVGGLAFNLNDPFFVGIHTNLGYNYARVPNYGYGRIGSTTAYSFGVAGNYFTAGVQGCTSATWWVAAF